MKMVRTGFFAVSFLVATMFFGSFSLTASEDVSKDAPEVVFAKAQALAMNGKHKGALREYEKIEPKGHDVYMNMGSCAYNLGRFGKAIFYWKRAERYWNWLDRSKLLHNIDHARAKATSRVVKGTARIWQKTKDWAFSLLVSVPLLAIQLLFLLIWFSLAFFLKSRTRETQKKAALPLFVLTALLGTIVLARYMVDFCDYGVITSKTANLHTGPGRDYPSLGKLSEGLEVSIKITADGFYKIQYGRYVGWASQKEVEKI